MREWNVSEAELMDWKRKLENVYRHRPTKNKKREQLKDELLAIINDPNESAATRLHRFKKRRHELLSDSHNQGWKWEGQFSGIASILSYILPKWILNLQKGSQLRLLLKDDFVPPARTLLSIHNTNQLTTDSLDDDSKFEQALYYDIAKALTDLKNRIDCADTETPSIEIQTLLERLYSIKERLEPMFYFNLMKKLYEVAPLQTTRFFADQFINEPDKAISLQNFMECFLLANQLIKKFIDSCIDTNQLHHGQELLLLLSLNEDIYKEAVTETYKEGMHQEPPQNIPHPLMQLIEQMDSHRVQPLHFIMKALQAKLGAVWSTNEQKIVNSNSVMDNVQALKAVYKKKLGRANLLVVHVARQLAERLLSNYAQNEAALKIDKDNPKLFGEGTTREYKSTIHFIGKNVFKINKTNTAFVDRDFLDLSKFPLNASIPPDVRDGERLAMNFNREIKSGQTSLLDCIRRAHCENIKYDNFTKTWVLARLELNLKPDDPLFKAAKHALSHPIVYKVKDFSHLFSLPKSIISNREQDVLESEIRQQFTLAITENESLHYAAEKEAIHKVIVALYKYILSAKTTTACLQKALNEFIPKLNHYHYLHSVLNKKLRTMILDKNEKLIHKDFKNIVETELTKNLTWLDEINSNFNHINRFLSAEIDQPDLEQVNGYIKTSIKYFAKYLESMSNKVPPKVHDVFSGTSIQYSEIFFENMSDEEQLKVKVVFSKLQKYLPKSVVADWSQKIGLQLPGAQLLQQLSFYNTGVNRQEPPKVSRISEHYLDDVDDSSVSPEQQLA